MTALEIFMIIIGLVIVVLSFIFSEQLQEKKQNTDIDSESLENKFDINSISRESIKEKIEEEVENYSEEAIEKTESQIDKVMNQKISAIDDFSKEVLVEIKKNHDEVIFLYNMLTEKEKVVKNTVKDVEAVKESLKKIEEPKVEKSEVVIKSDEKIIKENQAKKIEKVSPMKASEVNELTNNNEMILSLYEKGIPNIQIAKELGLGIGEVRLVIDLFKTRNQKK